MNAYEQKQADRKQRQADRARRLHAEAQRLDQAAGAAVAHIPFGQPILVGHHSERRHRRDLARCQALTRKAIATEEAARDLERRASTESRAISSDNEDAVPKLQAKLAALESAHARMVAANKLIRKNDRAGLAALGFTEAQIADLFTPDFARRVGFPAYALSNSSANIRSTKQRIEALKAAAAARQDGPAPEPVPIPGGTITEDRADNRLCIRFEVRQSSEVVALLKSNGFKWSPTRGAWVRMLNNAARFAATCIAGRLSK